MLGNLKKGKKSSEKICLKKCEILLETREDVLDGFKSNLFPIESENTPCSIPRGSKINVSEINGIFIDDTRKSEKKNKQ